MTLVKVISDRTNENGRPYEDYYLVERLESGRLSYVRVRACFPKETYYLRRFAVTVPSGEPLEKYL